MRACAAYRRIVTKMQANGEWDLPTDPCPIWSVMLRTGHNGKASAMLSKFKDIIMVVRNQIGPLWRK